MGRALLLAIAASLAAGTATAPAAVAQTAVAAKDWTRVVVATPEGGFRAGNPDAPLKLVEYGSLTCDHCANFARQGVPELLDKYVKSGSVSFEFRNFVRDPADLAAALLSRCAGTGDFFALTDGYFSSQAQWIGKLQAMGEEQAEAINALPVEQRLVRIASLAGLDAMAAKAGVPAARAKQCLVDQAAIEKLVAMNRTATETHQLKGTPTFLINGKTVAGVHDWTSLKPLLGPPGG